MISTSTPLGIDFPKQIVSLLLKTLDESTKQAFRMVWNILMSFLIEHWVAVIIILFIVLVYAVIRALLGHWWVFGSVLYNYFYFGILFLIGLIWGPEVFANDYFKIFLTILYITCFTVVGVILNKTGLRKKF